jgi:protein-disulfide isomerase
MNYRVILFVICTLLLSSCSDKESGKPAEKPQEKQVADDNATTQSQQMVAAASAIPVIDDNSFKIDMRDHVLGNRDAKVVLMEYSSPTCPHCSYFHKEILPKLKEKYVDTGKISYVLREFVANKQDLDAALLGRCYKDESDPMKLLNLLYIQQDSWAFNKNYREILTNIGGLAGISREKYMECLSDKGAIDFLLKQARIITSYPGFVGTPAFLVDGVMHKGAYSFDGLSKSIDAKLKQLEEKDE